MKFVVSFINIILMLFCFSNNKNVILNNNEIHNSFMTYASLNDNSVKQLFNSLESGLFDDLYINDYYEGVYFSNLHENISNNSHGTCSYVAIGMFLSYYDSYWDDSFIPEEFDIESESYFKTCSSGDFSIQSFYAESPGILFEPSNEVESLSSSTSLPIYRDSHKFYKIKFDNPVYRIRFYARSFKSYINENNRGRICIGNMAIYPSEYNFPLSGGELDYEPSMWNDTIIGQFLWKNEYLKEKTNCYSYAVNAQINPSSNSLEFMQPGQATGKKLNENDILDKNKILSLIKEDANKLGFIFSSIESNERCQEKCYKVAFVIDNQYKKGDVYKYDYHWYRQNSDGTWSHKPGGTNVTKLDCDNKIIMNPLEANRNVGQGLNYNLFVGFFTIKPLNIYY